MNRIKLDSELIKYISIFQRITNVSPRDCIDEEEQLVFIIPEIDISKAIGKAGANAKKIESLINRKIKIVGYNPELIAFVRNVIYPYRAEKIEESEGLVTITPSDSYARGQLIGRNASRLRKTEGIVKRYFKISEIKVI